MIWYLLGINIITFVVYGIDKYNAIKKKYRVSEYNLFIFAFFGGAIGALVGMRVFHHKTRKLLFWILNILFLVGWVLVLFNLK